MRAIVDLVTTQRLPSAGFKEFADAGGLIGYGPSFTQMCRRAGFFVDAILKGGKPGDIPVEQATKFDFVLNLKAARTLGATMPTSILLRADEVIE